MLRRYCATGLRCFPLIVLGTACADQGPGLPSCSTHVDIAVTAGTQPTFTWTPACQIYSLAVERGSPSRIVWSTFSVDQSNSIAAPVQYGIAPPGAALTANLLEPKLVAGTTHKVTLLRIEDGQGDATRTAGVATFVP